MRKIFLFLSLINLYLIIWTQISSIAEENNKEEEVFLEKIIVTDRGYYVDPVYYPLAVPASEESTTSVVSSGEIKASHKKTAVEAIENVRQRNPQRVFQEDV